MALAHTESDGDVFEEGLLLEDLDGFLEVDDALLEHAQLLETHGHVVVGDVGEVAVPLAVVQVHHLQHALRLLQQHVRLLPLVLLYELVRDVSQLQQQQRNLILVDLDLFIIKPMKRIILISCMFSWSLVNWLTIGISRLLLWFLRFRR